MKTTISCPARKKQVRGRRERESRSERGVSLTPFDRFYDYSTRNWVEGKLDQSGGSRLYREKRRSCLFDCISLALFTSFPSLVFLCCPAIRSSTVVTTRTSLHSLMWSVISWHLVSISFPFLLLKRSF